MKKAASAVHGERGDGGNSARPGGKFKGGRLSVELDALGEELVNLARGGGGGDDDLVI